LTCTGTGGSANQTVQVTILPAPVVSLTANPTSVASGGSSTLTWSSTNATSCTASVGWTGAKTLSGTQSTGALTVTTSYTLTCTGTGGTTAATATVTVGATSGIFPLHVDPTKRYLVDAQGNPFFMNGDTPWDLVTQLTDAEADQYFADRQAKGINVMFFELMEHYTQWTTPSHVPNNVYGDPPFLTAGDFSTPNEAYMAHVATILQLALNRGMLVLMTPSYAGFDGQEQGWYVEMQANGVAKLRTFGQYVANRFAAYPNLVWVEGGDYSPSDHSLIDAIANGIRDVNTTWLQTFHGGRFTNALDWATASETWVTLNDIYTDESTIVSQANKEYAKSMMPFFLIESRYETGSAGDGALVRPQMYAANLSGADGYMIGYEDLWPFAPGWQDLMDSQGIVAMKYMGQLWTSRSWWLLMPDGTGKAAYASNGSFGFAYAKSGSVTVDLGKFAGPNVRAQWYDPTTGAFSTASGSPFPVGGTRTLTHSGANSLGDADWVLVLDSQ
jgi:hypothetical protein